MVDPTHLQDLVRSKVLAFEAVHDWFYLTLDRAWVCLYNSLVGEESADERAKAIIDTEVTEVELKHEEFLTFTFSNGSVLTMSLRPEAYGCPEAAVITYRVGEQSVKTVVIL